MSNNLKFSQLTDHIWKLTLSQPARRNAINANMWENIPVLLDQAASTPGLKVLIVTGDGEHFASGADISEFETLYANRDSAKSISEKIAAGLQALADFPLPTLAMIRGACVGGGCGLALCCDLRFADNTARFAITPAKLGLVYPFADVQRLINTVGLPNARDILLSSRLIKARRAEKMGLVNKLFKPDDLEADVMAYAEQLTQLSTHSARVTKQMFARWEHGQRAENDKSLDMFLDGFVSADFQEGYRAFLEKRHPRFK